MVPLYTLFLAGLGGLKWVLAGRAARAERKYTAAALVAEQAARQTQVKPGNASADPLALAKRYYELGRLVEDRDARYEEDGTITLDDTPVRGVPGNLAVVFRHRFARDKSRLPPRPPTRRLAINITIGSVVTIWAGATLLVWYS